MRCFAGKGKPRERGEYGDRDPVVNTLTGSRYSVQPSGSKGDGYGQPGDIAALIRPPRLTQASEGAEMTGLVLENLAEYSEHPGKITELYEARAM
ncbi:MAG TPA: hypothetical protein PKD21_11655 [Candidatus Competibacter phosphatis]|nr:hypothetical protein [Candidatus Competibacter phosphatis]